MNIPRAYRSGILIAVLLMGVVGGGVLWRYNPVEASFFPKCPSITLFGLYCPGCGTTRALHQLLHGHLWNAIRYNVLMVAAIIFLLLAWRKPSLLRDPKVTRAVMYVALGYLILRNLPVKPFVYLAPYGKPAPIFASQFSSQN